MATLSNSQLSATRKLMAAHGYIVCKLDHDPFTLGLTRIWFFDPVEKKQTGLEFDEATIERINGDFERESLLFYVVKVLNRGIERGSSRWVL